jgi:Rrf2 family protein
MHNYLLISEASSIAIHSLSFIERDDSYSNASKIASNTNLSRNYLLKILLLLTKHGYLQSERGSSRGFKMLKPAYEITLPEIFELIDGNQKISNCAKVGQECSFKCCVYGDIVQRSNLMLTDYFKTRTLAHIINN